METQVTLKENRTIWSAIFAGTVITLVIQITLALLGIGIGFSTINPATEAVPVGMALGIGSVIWWLLISIVALYFGGWTASRLAGIHSRLSGMMHGLITWGMTSLVMVFLFTSTMGAVLSGGFGLLKNAGQILSSSPELRQQLQSQIEQGAQGGAMQQPQQQPAQGGPQQQAPVTEERAREIGQTAANSAASASLGMFFVMLLGGVAAALGGSAGRSKTTAAM